MDVVKEIGGAGGQLLYKCSYKWWCVTSNDITLNGANLVFEGYQANAYETTITVAEPTGDRTITLPDSSGV